MKVGVTHASTYAPSLYLYTQGVCFPYHSYLCTMACGLEPSICPHFVPLLFHMTHAI